jgi:hypothetical protein
MFFTRKQQDMWIKLAKQANRPRHLVYNPVSRLPWLFMGMPGNHINPLSRPAGMPR